MWNTATPASLVPNSQVFTPKALHHTAQGRERSERTLGQ
jgi:hypothetical protein